MKSTVNVRTLVSFKCKQFYSPVKGNCCGIDTENEELYSSSEWQ